MSQAALRGCDQSLLKMSSGDGFALGIARGGSDASGDVGTFAATFCAEAEPDAGATAADPDAATAVAEPGAVVGTDADADDADAEGDGADTAAGQGSVAAFASPNSRASKRQRAKLRDIVGLLVGADLQGNASITVRHRCASRV